MPRTEKLGHQAAVKATMLQAHLAWAAERVPDLPAQLRAHVPAECAAQLDRALLATEWIPFRCLVAIDRAIAGAVGGGAEHVYRELGRHSATVNLGGVYKSFVAEEPHRFFEQASLLHGRFQNFGRASYERTGERAGRLRFEGYEEWSPVYCASAVGYFTEALRLMKVPGPAQGAETYCQCAGAPACLFELAWLRARACYSFAVPTSEPGCARRGGCDAMGDDELDAGPGGAGCALVGVTSGPRVVVPCVLVPNLRVRASPRHRP